MPQRFLKLLVLLVVATVALALPTAAQAGGELDTTFGAGGYVTDLMGSGLHPGGADGSTVVGDRLVTVGVADTTTGLSVSTNDVATGAPLDRVTFDQSLFAVDTFVGAARVTTSGTRAIVAVLADDGGVLKLLVMVVEPAAAPLGRDLAWGTDGWVLVDLNGLEIGGSAGVGAVAVADADDAGAGSIWVAGQSVSDDAQPDDDLFLAHLKSDGTVHGIGFVDTGSAAATDVDDRAIGLHPSLDHAAIGYTAHPTTPGDPAFGVVRIAEDGTSYGAGVSPFTSGGTPVSGAMAAMVARNARFIFVGELTTVGGGSVPAAVSADDALAADPTFGDGGVLRFPQLTDTALHAVRFDGLGRGFIGGWNYVTGRPLAIGMFGNGALLGTFGTNGVAQYDLPAGVTSFVPKDVHLDASSRVTIVGEANPGGTNRMAALRTTAPGSGSIGGGGTPGGGTPGGGTPGSSAPGGGTAPPVEEPAKDPTVTPPVATAPTGFVFPSISILQGTIYAPEKLASMPDVRPRANRYTSVDDAKSAIDAAGFRAKYVLVGVARTGVPAANRKAITAGGVFAQQPAPRSKTRVTPTSAPTTVLLRYYDPSKDPRDPVCDYANANRDLTDASQPSAVSWLVKNRCQYVLRTIPTRGAADRYVLRAKVEKSTLPGGRILVVELADPVVSDFVFGFRESRNAGGLMSFDVRDWALSAGSTQNTFTVQVLERLTGRFVQGATVEVSYRQAGATITGTRRLLTDRNGEATFRLTLPVPGTLQVDAIVYGRNGRNAEGDANVTVKQRTADVWTTGGRRLAKSGTGFRLQAAGQRRRAAGWNQVAATFAAVPPLEYGRLDALAADQLAPIIRLAQVRALAVALAAGMNLRFEDALRMAQSSVPPVESFRTMLGGTGMTPTQLTNGGTLVAGTGGPSLVPSCPGLMDVGGTLRSVSGTCIDLDPKGSLANIVMGAEGVVAAGGGNVVAAGGANAVAAGGGNVVAAGGANAVAAGGANVVAAGGGNVIAAGGGNVIAAGGGNVVAAGGANAMPVYGASLVAGRNGP